MSNKQFYIGYTNNIKRRLEEHDIVHMSFEDFKKLLTKVEWE